LKPIDQAPAQRPTWLPSYIPELQGLRGLAVLGVVFYHSRPRLEGTPFYGAAAWGWAGVNLFFVLSGFLITSILLESRGKPHYFRNFYGRRVLRIWPVYVLTLAICYVKADWFVGEPTSVAIRTAPWWAYIFFVQNLFHLNLPPGIGPTWSLAIEEQYYVIWAPLVRFLKRPWMMAGVLGTALVVSPMLRMTHFGWITTTDTVTHLDGIAMGSLIALGLHTVTLARRTWLMLGGCGMLVGFPLAFTVAGGTAFLDSALSCGFGGAVLAAIASTGARNWVSAALRRGPLAYYGKISYGLYMIHIMVFIYYGWFDLRMDKYGMAGNMAVIGVRLAAATAAATVLWYGFESRILKLKRYF
jgi:peptidoglycan/LPS O-acetylase OafA/YrhL